MNNLHGRIKSTRINRGLSQARLAKETGVSQPTIANWENGSHIPRKRAMMRISSALDVEETWLLSGQKKRVHQTIEAYLARPIRHVPIYGWPAGSQDIFAATPEGYLPYPTVLENAFALADRSESAIKHRIMIFDPDYESLKPQEKCLWTHEFATQVGTFAAAPKSAKIIGQLKTEIKTY